MNNELFLCFSLIFIYGMVFLSFVLFEEHGLLCWTVFATITANIEVLIRVEAFGMVQTLGNVLFASSFLVTDILSELYGKKSANRAVNLGIFTSIFFVLLTQSWFLYTPDTSDFIMPSIHAVFENTPRMMISSLLVYAIAQRLDVWLYHLIWHKTETYSGSKKPFLWLRNNGSTLVSQLINTILFNTFAFYGSVSFPTLCSFILSGYVIFIFTSLLDTPIVYWARMWHNNKKNNSSAL